jgi:hypothetical protein
VFRYTYELIIHVIVANDWDPLLRTCCLEMDLFTINYFKKRVVRVVRFKNARIISNVAPLLGSEKFKNAMVRIVGADSNLA